MILLISIIIAFLLGSIPSGYILTKKYCNVDIRTQGSGNIGSTNVKRIAGSKISAATQAIDIIKGLIPVALAMIFGPNLNLPISLEAYVCIIAITSILGHDFTPFLSFNGGKGVNTTLGAFFLIAPIPTLASVLVHILLRYVTKVVSIRSMILGLTIPILSFILGYPMYVVIASFIAAIILILRHMDNIKRIINKEEK